MNDINERFQEIKKLLAQLESDVSGSKNIAATDRERLVEVAFFAVRHYAETHPRPLHVTQKQAGEMLGLSSATISKLLKFGKIKLNATGQIPITEIDRLLAVSDRP